MEDLRLATLGGLIALLQIINGLLLGFGIFTEGFYIDGTPLDEAKPTLSGGSARGIIYGTFLTAFVCIWISFGQFCSHIFIILYEKANSKVNGIVGAFICSGALIICIFGHVCIASVLDTDIIHKGLAYSLLTTGTVTIGITTLIAFIYGVRVFNDYL